MLTRRRFVRNSAVTSAALAAYPPLMRNAFSQAAAAGRPLRLAVIGNVYRRGSHFQTIADRFMVGFPYQGDWHMPNVQVVSAYVDQRIRMVDARPTEFEQALSGVARQGGGGGGQRPAGAAAGAPGATGAAGAAGAGGGRGQGGGQLAAGAAGAAGAGGQGGGGGQRGQGIGQGAAAAAAGLQPLEAPGPTTDLSQSRATQFGFRIYQNVQGALRCGTDRIAVDAVLSVFEQGGDYPYAVNSKGQALVPSYDFFQQCAQVFEEEKNAVPYFNHNALSFSFAEAQNMVKTAERLKFPLMAGSSMPVTWRLPDIDVPLGAQVQEVVMVGPSGFRGSEFDALEAMQSMLERRKGGETGVKAVQLLEGDDVWAARKAARWSNDLLSSALSRSDTPLGLTVLDGRTQNLAAPGVLEQLVPNPVAYCIEYTDGTKATLLVLDGAIQDYNISVRVAGHGLVATQFFMTPDPNESYSACLAGKIEQMYQTKSAPYSVQRTLLTTGLLEAGVNSRHRLNQRLETPQLAISYQPPAESQYART